MSGDTQARVPAAPAPEDEWVIKAAGIVRQACVDAASARATHETHEGYWAAVERITADAVADLRAAPAAPADAPLPAAPGGGAPDVTECLQMLLGWFDNGKKRHLAGKLVYLPTERMEECRAALAAAVPPAPAAPAHAVPAFDAEGQPINYPAPADAPPSDEELQKRQYTGPGASYWRSRCERAEAALREIRQGALDAMNDAQSTHHESLGDIAAIAGRALSGARPGEDQ